MSTPVIDSSYMKEYKTVLYDSTCMPTGTTDLIPSQSHRCRSIPRAPIKDLPF